MAKYKLNYKGFAELRNSPAVRADLARRAEKIAAAAGPGFVANKPEFSQPGSKGPRPRGRSSVGTGDYRSRRAQAKGNVLQRALNAGRD